MCLSLVPLAVLQAQETERKNPAGREQPGRTEGKATEGKAEVRVSGAASSNQLDRYFVTCLKSDNKGEVTIATLGSQRASNPDVKAFAQLLVKDHSDFLAKLDRFEQANPGAARTSGTTIRTETRDDATNPNRQVSDKTKPRTDRPDATNPPARTDARTDVRVDVNRTDRPDAALAGRGGDIADQLAQIKQEINEKCVASAQRELSTKEGSEFDKCFVGMQIGAHMHMVDALSVLSTRASPELQQILEGAQQTTQQHLDHAKQLAKKLEGGATSAGERPATGATKTDRKSPEKDK